MNLHVPVGSWEYSGHSHFFSCALSQHEVRGDSEEAQRFPKEERRSAALTEGAFRRKRRGETGGNLAAARRAHGPLAERAAL